MEKEKFFSGLWIIIGLIFGSVFTNFVYQDYLAYGGTVRSLVLNNTDLYKASISLFFYILFKRGKQYAFIYLGAYLLQPWIFLYSFAFCMAFFFGSMLSLQIVQMGIKGLVLVFMSLFPHFICYVITLLLLICSGGEDERRNAAPFSAVADTAGRSRRKHWRGTVSAGSGGGGRVHDGAD